MIWANKRIGPAGIVAIVVGLVIAVAGISLAIGTFHSLRGTRENTDDSRRPSLEHARADLVETIGLMPLAGTGSVDLGAVKSKSNPEYLTADGRLSLTPEVAAAHMTESVKRAGFSPIEYNGPAIPGAVAPVVTACRGPVIARFVVFKQLGIHHAKSGEVFVQFSVGQQDPRLGWTQVGNDCQ